MVTYQNTQKLIAFHSLGTHIHSESLSTPLYFVEMAETNGGELSVEDKINLIEYQLQEVLDKHIYQDVLKKGERSLAIYWGV